jgi:hypothetical protein
LCEGGSTGTVSLNVSGGTLPYSYKWSSNAGGVITPTVSNLTEGTYNVTVTESGGKKCSAVGLVEIKSPEFGIQAVISAKETSGSISDDGTICIGDEVRLVAETLVPEGRGINSYRWNGD